MHRSQKRASACSGCKSVGSFATPRDVRFIRTGSDHGAVFVQHAIAAAIVLFLRPSQADLRADLCGPRALGVQLARITDSGVRSADILNRELQGSAFLAKLEERVCAPRAEWRMNRRRLPAKSAAKSSDLALYATTFLVRGSTSQNARPSPRRGEGSEGGRTTGRTRDPACTTRRAQIASSRAAQRPLPLPPPQGAGEECAPC
jgi:hypothetical protein